MSFFVLYHSLDAVWHAGNEVLEMRFWQYSTDISFIQTLFIMSTKAWLDAVWHAGNEVLAILYRYFFYPGIIYYIYQGLTTAYLQPLSSEVPADIPFV